MKYPTAKKWLTLWYWQDKTEEAQHYAYSARSQLSEKEFWA